MKTICTYNTGEPFKEEAMPIGFLKTSIYNLELGKEYIIMGIILYDNVLMYLIDDDSKPDWYPYQLFQVSESLITSDWHFRMVSKNESPHVKAIWGYYELCFEANHYDDLLERDSRALEIYFDRKKEMIS